MRVFSSIIYIHIYKLSKVPLFVHTYIVSKIERELIYFMICVTQLPPRSTQWLSSDLVTGRFQVQNQVYALMPFHNALILITKSFEKDYKPLVP